MKRLLEEVQHTPVTETRALWTKVYASAHLENVAGLPKVMDNHPQILGTKDRVSAQKQHDRRVHDTRPGKSRDPGLVVDGRAGVSLRKRSQR